MTRSLQFCTINITDTSLTTRDTLQANYQGKGEKQPTSSNQHDEPTCAQTGRINEQLRDKSRSAI